MNKPRHAETRLEPLPGWRGRLHEVIYEADTPLGKLFDILILVLIVASVLAVLLESVGSIDAAYHAQLHFAEWALTIIFTIEYTLRLITVKRPAAYARSFFGVVDLLAILPTYLSLFIGGAQSLLVIRALRLLRVFRIFKLARYLDESRMLMVALRASLRKILIFLFAVLTLVIIIGSAMYLIEGGIDGSSYTSIPRSIYWTIVTLTTVGYGDITPQTVPGQVLASMVMILGYGMIAVPTGIVSVEMAKATSAPISTQACPACSLDGHAPDAKHCKFCGEKL